MRRRKNSSFRSTLISGFKVRTLANWRLRQCLRGWEGGCGSILMVTMARPKAEARGASTLGRPPAWQDQLRSLHFLQKLLTAAGPPWTKPHSSSITRGLFSFCFNLKLQGNFKLPAEAISEIADNHLTGFASIPSCQGGGAVQAEPERGHLLGSPWKLQLCFPQLGHQSLAESQKTLGGLPDPCPHLLCSSRQA